MLREVLKAASLSMLLAACGQEDDFVLSPFEPLYCDQAEVATLHWIALGDFASSGDVVERTRVGEGRAVLDSFPRDTREVAVRAYDAAGVLVAAGRSPAGGLADRQTGIVLGPVGSYCGSGSALGESRIAPRVVALPDGGAIVVGGDGRTEESALVEHLDPSTAEVLPAPSLAAHRARHTATAIGSRVLVAGGVDRGVASSEAELYDPSAGVLETFEMTQARAGHAATEVGAGVLVCGGRDERGVLAGADLYETSSGRFTAVGSLGTARADHALVARAADAVAIGGVDADGTPVGEVERWDPASRSFETLAAEAPIGRAVAAVSPAGVVVAVGEAGAVLLTPSGEVRALESPFEPTVVPDVALALADGSVAFFGAGQASRYSVAGWEPLPDVGRSRVGAAMLADGSLFVAGGEVGGDPSSAFDLLRIDLASDYSTPESPLLLAEPLGGVDLADAGRWTWVAAGLSSGLEGTAGAAADVTIGRYTGFELHVKIAGQGTAFIGFQGDPRCRPVIDGDDLEDVSCSARAGSLSRVEIGVESGTLRFRELTISRR